MQKKKTLYLMRHGQTLFNVKKKVQGWCDSPLTALGMYQAEVAATYFRKQHIDFDYAYASTSERACDTLEIITDMPYTRKKGLKEWNFGLFESESESLNPPLPYGDFFTYYGGESEQAVKHRITTTIKEIMEQADHNTVLIVSHGATCAQFYREWEALAKVKRDGRLQNCCILKYEYENGSFTLVELWNENIDTLPK